MNQQIADCGFKNTGVVISKKWFNAAGRTPRIFKAATGGERPALREPTTARAFPPTDSRFSVAFALTL
jgi:hypothetical protein